MIRGRCHGPRDRLVGGAPHDVRIGAVEEVQLRLVVGLLVLRQAETELPEVGSLVGEETVKRVIEHRGDEVPHRSALYAEQRARRSPPPKENVVDPRGIRPPALMAATLALSQLSYGPRAARLPRRSVALGTDLRPPPPGRCGIPRTFVPSTHAADAGSARVTGGDT